MLRFFCGAAVVSTALALTAVVRADSVDEVIAQQMAKRQVPGLSLAIIQDGKIVKAKAYGVIEVGGHEPVTTDTLFQAGSVSKSVAALGALALVEKGKLALDADVNEALKTWHVPENSFTKENKVTLRRLLSHSAGFSVHGFPGYAVDEPRPSLVEVLDGKKPTNTAAVRVEFVPGSRWRYSGGGYTVMQQLMIDVSGQAFPELMRATVLEPLGLRASTFEQPLPIERAALTATGYYSPDKAVPGRWHVYPEMAAAELWTTPSDLARFAIALQDSLAGRKNPVISQTMTREMLTRQKDDDGLGVFLFGQGKTQRFEHNGRDEGFDTLMTAYQETGQGAVIMINVNDNSNLLVRVMSAIAEAYRWEAYPRFQPAKAIEDTDPAVTAQVKETVEQAQKGKYNRALYTDELANLLEKSFSSGLPEKIKAFGALKSIELIGRKTDGGDRQFHYRLAFEHETVLVNCGYDQNGKINLFAVRPE